MTLQVIVCGTSVFEPVGLLADALCPPRGMRNHINSLQCLNDLHVSGWLSHRYFPPEPRGRRLSVVLQALDGYLAGASYREIARALFGPIRTEADWSNPGDHLRDHVRRAIKRGRSLMEGGYRQFLR